MDEVTLYHPTGSDWKATVYVQETTEARPSSVGGHP